MKAFCPFIVILFMNLLILLQKLYFLGWKMKFYYIFRAFETRECNYSIIIDGPLNTKSCSFDLIKCVSRSLPVFTHLLNVHKFVFIFEQSIYVMKLQITYICVCVCDYIQNSRFMFSIPFLNTGLCFWFPQQKNWLMRMAAWVKNLMKTVGSTWRDIRRTKKIIHRTSCM